MEGVGVPQLPVTLRFWDGSVLKGGVPVVEVRDPAGKVVGMIGDGANDSAAIK